MAQLLNRNPQHRLGAQRDAQELKEHPFFKSIDWDLLAKKQITPPFKPVVDSDESVANFDPEFTNSSLTAAGINPFSDDDPYEAPAPGGHSYVGPGGSLSKSSHMGGAAMAIKPQRPNILGHGSPLTSSVQENFRGFTYTGESLLVSSGRDRRARAPQADPALSQRRSWANTTSMTKRTIPIPTWRTLSKTTSLTPLKTTGRARGGRATSTWTTENE